MRDRREIDVKKNSGGGELNRARSSMVTLYGEPLEMAVKRGVAPLSRLPKIAIKFQKWITCDYIGGNTA